MTTPLITAVANQDRDELRELLAEDVTFNSPVRSYTGREEVIGEGLKGLSLVFAASPDGTALALASITGNDKSITVWDVASRSRSRNSGWVAKRHIVWMSLRRSCTSPCMVCASRRVSSSAISASP